MTLRTCFLPLLLAALGLGCGRVSETQARNLVVRYNEAVSEAYRKNDILLIDPVVGPNAPDGRRLTGLIGVHADMGIALDAHLESLEVAGVEEGKGELRVHTREQWRYRDVQVATGAQVGEASVDRYEMLYLFRKQKGAWMVEETSFAAPPQVGRKEIPWTMDAKDAHSIATPPPGKP